MSDSQRKLSDLMMCVLAKTQTGKGKKKKLKKKKWLRIKRPRGTLEVIEDARPPFH